MAKGTVNKRRINQFLSLITPETINLTGEDDEQVQAPLAGGNSVKLNDSGGDNSRLASSRSLRSPIRSEATVTQSNNPTTSVVTQATNERPLVTVQQPNKLLSGNIDFNKLTGELLDTTQDEQYTPTLSGQPNIQRQRTNNEITYDNTPEGRLLGEIQNTNPHPRSIWKRIALGTARGAATIQPGEGLDTALGRLIGGAVAQSIPQVDSAQQYQQNKSRAIERYKIEDTARDQQQEQRSRQLQQQKLESDLKINQQKLEDTARERKLLNDARLRDDNRAEAKQLLDTLKELPADAIERYEHVKRLKELGVKVPANFGVDVPNKKEQAQRTFTAIDEETGDTIRVDNKGVPVLTPEGNKIVTKKATEKTTSNKAEAEADEPEVFQGALRNQAMNEARKQFPKASKMNDAELLADEEYGAWVRARTSDLVQESNATRKRNINKRAAGNKSTTKSTSKIQPSRKASEIDFSKYLR